MTASPRRFLVKLSPAIQLKRRSESLSSKVRRFGFTLIELLVVIAIIAVLIAILLPTFSKAKQMAIRTQCASNMRQIYLGLYMYTNDNNGNYPTMLGQRPPNFTYWWIEPQASILLTGYFNNNYAILSCPGWLQNTVWYSGNSALANDDGNPQAVAKYWWNFDGAPPASGIYPNNYRHIIGYEVLCNNNINSQYFHARPIQSDIFGTTASSRNGANTIPPPPTTYVKGVATVSYYIQKTNESGNKVLIADETGYINDPSSTFWHNWGVSHATLGGKNTTPPQGANHCTMDGSVSWNGTDALQERYEQQSGTGSDDNYYQEWW